MTQFAEATATRDEATGPRRVWASLYALIPITLSALVYYPVTRNYFYADDFEHLYLIADGRVPEFLVTPHGGHMLVARNALFVLSHAAFGTDPRGYLWLALLTHLLNVALLFRVLRLFTRSPRLACFGATLWGTSPLAESTVGWYSVYGQVVLTAIVLWVLLQMGRAAAGETRPTRAGVLTWYVLLLVGTTCFGIGIGVALAAGAAALLLLPGAPYRFAHRLFASFVLVVPALYAAVQWLYAQATGRPHESVQLTVHAFDALAAVLRLTAHLAAFGAARPLTGYLAPAWAYPGVGFDVLAGLYWLGVAAALVLAAPARRRQLLACLALAVGAYGIVAVGRAPGFATGAFAMLFESLAQMSTLPRYHYTATAALAIAGCLVLAEIGRRVPLRPPVPDVLLAAWLGLSAAAFVRHPLAIDHFDESREQVAHMRERLRQAAAAAPAGGPVFVHNRAVYPIALVDRPEIFPGWAALFVVLFDDNRIDGRPIQFIERNPDVVAAVRRRAGTRTASLLVTRDEFRRATGLPPLPAR